MSTPTGNSVSASAVSLSGSNIIDSLVSGYKWSSTLGASVSLTYSFPTASSYWSTTNYPQYSTEPWRTTAALDSTAQSAAMSENDRLGLVLEAAPRHLPRH